MGEAENADLTHDEGKPVTRGPTNGTLLIHGDVDGDLRFKDRFRELSGGPGAKLVYIPTAFRDDQLQDLRNTHLNASSAARRFGFSKPADILHTRCKKEADTYAFIKPLLEADAVFIEGGRQPRLADSYLNTRTHRELERLLERGGVIAGTSAGATIQGSFMIRNQGAPNYDPSCIFDRDYETEGFGFVKNVAIDQHVVKRKRASEMLDVLKKHPHLLGIGIDENTAICVQGDVFTVIGKSVVIVSECGKSQICLRDGDRYNMALRRVYQSP